MTDGDDRGLVRQLGRFDLTCVVMGAIIGVGIFFGPRRVAELTGAVDVTLAAWVLGGLVAVIGSLTFAELGVVAPETGGQYLVLRRAWGRPVAFLYGWSLLAVIQSGAIAIIALIAVENLAVLVGVDLGPKTGVAGAVVLVAALLVVNVIGMRQGAGLNNVVMIAKVSTLGALIALGLFFAPTETVNPDPVPSVGDGSWSLLLPALIPVMFSFGGWQQALYVAGEVREPGRTMPFGIIVGVSAVALLYVGVNVAYLNLLGIEGMAASSALAADAASAALPGIGGRLCAAAVAISALGIANVCIMTAPRMYKAMADDGCFGPAMASVSPRFRTPVLALVAQCAVATTLLIGMGKHGVDHLLTGVVCVDWLFFGLTGAAIFALRRQRPAREGYRALGYPWLPGVFVLVSAAIVVAAFIDETTRQASVVAAWTVAAGAGAYVLFCRGR